MEGHLKISPLVVRIRTLVPKLDIKAVQSHGIVWLSFWLVVTSADILVSDRAIDPLRYLKNIVFYIIVFYVVLHWAFIQYLPKQVIKSIIACFFLITGMAIIKVTFDRYVFHTNDSGATNPFSSFIGMSKYIGFTIKDVLESVIFALGYWYYLQSTWLQKQQLIIEQQLTKTRISFLKAQINPHFLYNTLNFFYSEAAITNPNVARSILLLSDIMRYTVSSSSEEKVSLAKEVEMIEKYLDIQRIRFGTGLQVNFQVEGFLAFRLVPPLILLTFVENAFKYGKLNDPHNPLNIQLSVDSKGLDFHCSNLKNTNFKEQATTGVGIDNIKQRLGIIYHSDFQLGIESETDFYTVSLHINF